MGRIRGTAAAVVVLIGVAAGLWWRCGASSDNPRTTGTSTGLLSRLVGGPRDVRPGLPAQKGEPWIAVVNGLDGRPLEGAQVQCGRAVSGEPAWTMTDARGRAGLAVAGGETCLGLVSKIRFASHSGPLSSGATIALVPLDAVHGIVVSLAGAPVADALVTSPGVPTSSSTRTDQDGRFVLLPSTPGPLIAEKDGVLGKSPALARLDPSEEVKIMLGTAGMSRMRVVDRDDAPLSEVEVRIAIGDIRRREFTAADGRFGLPTVGGALVEVRLSKPGYVPISRWYGGYYDDFEVVLSRPARIEGTFVDLRGQPIGLATIYLEEPFTFWNLGGPAAVTPALPIVDADSFEPLEVRRASGLVTFAGRRAAAQTDARGRFEVSGLGQRRVRLSATAPDGNRAEAVVELPEDETVTVTLMPHPPLSPVKVEVVTGAGDEVSDFDLTAVPVPPVGWSVHAATPGEVQLTRGQFHFTIATSDGRRCDETREVDPRPDMAPLRFVVRGDGGSEFFDELPPTLIRVKAVTPAGAPIQDAHVDCEFAEGFTDAAGRYTCEVRAPDRSYPLKITASTDDAMGLARATGSEPEVVVVVRRRGTLHGRIDGPLPALGLSLWVKTMVDAEEVFPLKGNTFALENRSPIRTYLCVNSEDGQLGCAISEKGEDVVIPVGPAGTLTFSVATSDGEPLADPIVYLDRTIFPFSEEDVDGGVFTLALAPGQHVIVVNEPGSRARYEQRITIEPGKLTALGVLRLQ